MSSKENAQKEDIKKLEDEAYFELMQIIAEALQMQDIELLDYRISTWKNKYRKLLEGAASPQFKKRIEFLLNQYYSSVTRYIMDQIKFKEQKMIENQAKALRELYTILRDTNDLALLKQKVSKWQGKYPVSAFLKMYQKKVESLTREKNLEQNAFDQDKAFSELVDITKVNGSLDDLKEELNEWEKRYSINDKYKIDDFIKHQSEIKRYISDDYLRSIAREELTNDKELPIKNVNHDNTNKPLNSDYSPLSAQAQAYSSLLAIAQKRNNVDEVFSWVYKNRNMKFNDKYKELILSATYLDYSPRFLQSMQAPEFDITKSSLTLSEYKNMREIKRYSAISYFNLLLPPNKSFSNNYFNNYVNKIYLKSQAKNSYETPSELTNSETLSSNEFKDYGIEIDLRNKISFDENTNAPDITLDAPEVEENLVEPTEMEKTFSENAKEEIKVSKEVPKVFEAENKLLDNTTKEQDKPMQDFAETGKILPEVTDKPLDPSNTKSFEEQIEKKLSLGKEEEIDTKSQTLHEQEDNDEVNTLFGNAPAETTKIDTIDEAPKESFEADNISKTAVESDEQEIISSEEDLSHDTIVAFSPMFFSIINNYSKQAVLVASIDQTTTKYVNSIERENEQSLDLHRATDSSF